MNHYQQEVPKTNIALSCGLPASSDAEGLHLAMPIGYEALLGNALNTMMTCVTYDPHDLGLECRLPPKTLKPLLDLCTNFQELCLPNKRKLTFLSTTELARKFGQPVINKYKLALNQVTKIVKRNQLSGEDTNHSNFNHTGPLSVLDGVIRKVTNTDRAQM